MKLSCWKNTNEVLSLRRGDRRELRRMSLIGLVTLGYTVEDNAAKATAGLTRVA